LRHVFHPNIRYKDVLQQGRYFMNLKINFNHMESTDAIKEKITGKAEKLTKYFDGKFDVTWTVSADKAGHHSHVTVACAGFTANADSTKDDLYKTLDDVLHKVEKQLQKHKSQMKDKIHHKHDQASY
jgi:putative sigma-54 modulation protein